MFDTVKYFAQRRQKNRMIEREQSQESEQKNDKYTAFYIFSGMGIIFLINYIFALCIKERINKSTVPKKYWIDVGKNKIK